MKRGSPCPSTFSKKLKLSDVEICPSKSPKRSVDTSSSASEIGVFLKKISMMQGDYVHIESIDERFGIQKCLDKFFDKSYVVGSDGTMEFKLKHILLRFDLNQVLDYFSLENPKEKAMLIYLMFGPVTRVVTLGGLDLVWIMWEEPIENLKVGEDFKPLADIISTLHKDEKLEFDVMQALISKPGQTKEQWSDHSIANLLFFMSEESQDWFFRKKVNWTLTSASEIPAFLAQLLFVASDLDADADQMYKIYNLITNCVARSSTEAERDLFVKSVWHELVDHLRDVSNLAFDQKRLAMEAISKFGKFLMNKAYNEGSDAESEMETEE